MYCYAAPSLLEKVRSQRKGSPACGFAGPFRRATRSHGLPQQVFIATNLFGHYQQITAHLVASLLRSNCSLHTCLLRVVSRAATMSFGTQLLSLFSRAQRRVPRLGYAAITGKQMPRFYKGKGATKTGIHTRRGRFHLLESMMPKYVVPDLTGFALKPYVAHYPRRPGGAAPQVAAPASAAPASSKASTAKQ